jgi:hypothetical protein
MDMNISRTRLGASAFSGPDLAEYQHIVGEYGNRDVATRRHRRAAAPSRELIYETLVDYQRRSRPGNTPTEPRVPVYRPSDPLPAQGRLQRKAIVIEGTDGIKGRSTQAYMLKEWLEVRATPSTKRWTLKLVGRATPMPRWAIPAQAHVLPDVCN